MGLKSNVKPGPIEVHESNETTPSVTPMRPTPLVGNWCDLPWAGDDGVSATLGTPSKLSLMGDAGSFLMSNVVASSSPSKGPIVPQQHAVEAAAKLVLLDPIAAPTMPPTESPVQRADTEEGDADDDDTMNDLYLVTPMDTLAADDFETEMAATAEFHPTPAKEEATEEDEEFALPSRASHFVDFRRLQLQKNQQLAAPAPSIPRYPNQAPQPVAPHQPAPTYTVQQRYAASYQVNAPPVAHSTGPTMRQPNYATAQSRFHAPVLPTPMPCPVGYPTTVALQPAMYGGQHHTTHGPTPTASQFRQPSVVVLISRFPPPPPPSKQSMDVLLRTGSSFQSYYAIVMRWYEKVLRSTPKAHPNVPPCPAAELYLHDFDGWVEQIVIWWTRHFTRRPKGQPQQHSRSNTAAAH